MNKLKRFIYIFIALFIMFPCVINAATELSAATQNPIVGNIVYIQLEANYGKAFKIKDFHTYIEFDENYLKIKDVTWLKFGSARGTSRIEKNRVYIDKTDGEWSSGPVVQFEFEVLKAGLTHISVNRNGESYYTNGDVIAQTTAGININAHEPSTNTDIGSLYVEGYTIQPTFKKRQYNYNLTVPANVKEITVVAKPGNEKQSIKGHGKVSLNYGLNNVKVTVTAQDKSTSTYVIKVTREDDRTSDTSLRSLQVSHTNIAYEEDKYVYEATVSRSVESVLISATPTDSKAMLIGTGTKKLSIGLNTFQMKITSSKGIEKTYTIKITRSNEEIEEALPSNKLKTLKINNFVMNLANNTTKFLYGIGKELSELSIEAIPESKTAKVQIDGNKKLISGLNYITITVTDEGIEGSTIYKIVVYKNPQSTLVIDDITKANKNKNYLYQTTDPTSNIIPKEIIENLKNNKTTLYYNVVNVTKGLMSQVVLKDNLPNEEIDATLYRISDEPLVYEFNLPEKTNVTLNISDIFENINVRVYSYNEEGDPYTLVTEGTQVKEGYVTFTTNNQTKYVITTSDLIYEQSASDRLIKNIGLGALGIFIGAIMIGLISNLISKSIAAKEKDEPLY